MPTYTEEVTRLRHEIDMSKHLDHLLPVGKLRFRGPCPFHGESNATCLAVDYSEERGWKAHCFVCAWDGDIINLTMQQCGMRFMDAVYHLGGRPVENYARDPWATTSVSAYPELTLSCSRCHVTLTVNGKRYKHDETTALFELDALADRRGWELASDMIAAVCHNCLGGQKPASNSERLAGHYLWAVRELKGEELASVVGSMQRVMPGWE